MTFFNPQEYSGVSWVERIPPSKSLLWQRTAECWIFNIYMLASIGGVLSVCETPEWLSGIENVTRAYIDMGVSWK